MFSFEQITISNRTIKNKSKTKKLNNEYVLPLHNIEFPEQTVPFLKNLLSLKLKGYPIESILFEISKNLLGRKLDEYKKYENSELSLSIPEETRKESDLIGTIYQYLIPKSHRLSKGTFYTNKKLSDMIFSGIEVSENDIILDPACGSGNLILNDKIKNPLQIIGIDYDELAIFCCKTNYYLKFGNNAPNPRIYHSDFFKFISKNPTICDYLVSNPPYGANIDSLYLSKYRTSKDTSLYDSSYFFIRASIPLAKKKSVFILPESITNVKKYTELREWIIKNNYLTRIDTYEHQFSGTMFPIILLTSDVSNTQKEFCYDSKKVSYESISKIPFYYFRPLDIENENFINRMFEKSTQSLKGSLFGLGIVTGDNKKKVFSNPGEGLEPIITGKDIHKYVIDKPKKYICYDRNNLQQVAPDELYRSKEKVVYKTVSKDMTFAIDTTGSLTLNSANFFIPRGLTISTKCLVALLNSSIYEKLNKILFGENKISRTNLENLPIPSIDIETQKKIENLIDSGEYQEVDKIIEKIFL